MSTDKISINTNKTITSTNNYKNNINNNVYSNSAAEIAIEKIMSRTAKQLENLQSSKNDVETIDVSIDDNDNQKPDKKVNKKNEKVYYSSGLNEEILKKMNKKELDLPASGRGLSVKRYEDIEVIGNSADCPQYEFKNNSNIQFEDSTGIGYLTLNANDNKDNKIKYYTVAMGAYYGNIGDKLLIKLKDGDKTKYMNVIIIDQKDSSETRKNHYMYHGMSNEELETARSENPDVLDDANIIEFVGNQTKIQNSIKKNTGTDESSGDCNDLGGIFKGKIQGIYKTGSYNFKMFKWQPSAPNDSDDEVHHGYWTLKTDK